MYINTRHPYQNLRQIGQGFTIYYWAYEQTNKQTPSQKKILLLYIYRYLTDEDKGLESKLSQSTVIISVNVRIFQLIFTILSHR